MNEPDWPVEFRFVRRFRAMDPEGTYGTMENVLQVRYLNNNTGVYFTNRDHRYHEWRDVPVVDESRISGGSGK